MKIFGMMGFVGWLVLSLATSVLAEENSASGAKKATSCFACHGKNGTGRFKIIEKDVTLLEERLIKYRSGELKNPMMNNIARKLSDQDITDLATYYARSGEE